MTKKINNKPWSIFHIALWGYSTVFSLIIVLLLLLPQSVTESKSSTNFVSGIISVIPIVALAFLIAFQHKQYRWNWWKIILEGYVALFSVLLLIFGVFHISSSHSANSNYVAEIIFIPFVILFLVVGKEKLPI